MRAFIDRLVGSLRMHRGAFRPGGPMLLTVSLCALGLTPANAATAMPKPAVRHVDRTVPQVSPPAPLHFSSAPTDGQFLHTGLFSEPLAPVGATTVRDNRALAHALLAYREAARRRGAPDAVGSLLGFLAAHPRSAWKPALELNLGIIYRETGHFSYAMGIWQAGWNQGRELESRTGRAIANDTVAYLSQLEAYLGRKELVTPLLASLKGREVGGTAAQMLTDSRLGLYQMRHSPGTSFRCGPLALERILTYHGADPSARTMRVLNAARSTPHGLSLAMVEGVATRAGLHFQMAYRKPGAKVIVPAVVNWKVGHYAAIVARVPGGYRIEDTTFGQSIRVSKATLDQQASGYFLVRDGPLPAGWRPVSAREGGHVWGRGNTGTTHDTGATGPGSAGPNKSSSCHGGCTTWSVELEVVGLQLHDRPVGYKPPVGPPVYFDLYYSHRDTQQPATFSYTNFGPKWTFNWLSYVTDTVNSTGQAVLYRRGGGDEPFTFPSTGATASYPGPYSQGILTRTVSNGNTTGFTLTFPSGAFERFAQAQGNQFFMTAVADPQGNEVTLTYDSQMRIVAVTDAIGQVTTLTYGLPANPLLVTKITDPFGRTATFTYDSSGLLASITDELGITSSYAYGQGSDPDFINTLTTPYGETHFTYGDSSTNSSLGSTRFLKAVDPLGRTTYVEFDQGVAPADSNGSGQLIDASLMPTGMNLCDSYLQWRNTFYFDPHQYKLATQGGSLNYADATVYHWLHTSDGAATSRVLESVKKPLENRVWYNYPNQANCIYSGVSSGGTVIDGFIDKPSAIGRVLDNGQTRRRNFQYNAEGNVTQATDAVGRQTTYTYAANGVDLLGIANTTGGQDQVLETRAYGSQHEPLSITGSNGMTAHYEYNTRGQLIRYTDPSGHATALSYDGYGYMQTVSGPVSGDTYTFAYDNMGRVAAVTDPAGSTVRYTYDAANRLVDTTYPDGTSSRYTYNLLDLASHTDRLGRTTYYTYDADRELVQVTDPLGHTTEMGYDGAGKLDSLTDRNGHTTTWALDVQSRVVFKQYPDGSTVSVSYENSDGLVASVTGAMGQITTFGYNSDDTVSAVSYYSHHWTPGVSFTYDPNYRRPTSMSDGTGTTTYTYHSVGSLGANRLETVTTPIAGGSGTDTVSYSYDALNRVVGMDVDGRSQSIGYGPAGRITAESNPLDSFTYGYSDGTSRVTSVTSSQGPALAMSYYGPQGDEQLEQITASYAGTQLDQLGYAYDADNNVTSLSVSAPTAESISYSYDQDNRLVSGLIGTGTPQYQYGYDAASNLTSITRNGSTQSYSYTVNDEIASGTYDANGNPTALNGNTYAWDAAGRIRSVTSSSGTTSTFTYNGLGRVVRVVQSSGGTTVSDHSYLWCGAELCLAHDNTQSGSPVSTQYFPQGAIISGTPYYYVRDRLGSVREMVGASGSVAAQYGYDPSGNRTVQSGSLASDIGYAGYFAPAGTGLDFALNRAYDPSDGRWLNRDPLGDAGGINLYAYVDGNPASLGDPLGLCPPQTGWCSSGAINAVSGAAGGAVAGGAALAEFGPVGIAVGSVVGAVTGGIVGYFSSNSFVSEVTSGADVGVVTGGEAPVSGLVGGAVGGAVTYAAQQLGAPDSVSLPLGGAAGGAVGGAVAPVLDDVATTAAEGGAIGAAAGATSAAVAAGLHALCGN